MVCYLIEVEQAVKKFKEVTALNQVNVRFEKGKIHGIIGRNGSGKTVLFKAICGFMKLDSGTILINSKPVKLAAAQDIGIIIEEPGFIDSMNGFKNLKLLASIKRSITDKEIIEAIKEVGLDPNNRKHVGKYSLGMRHRLAIAQAIMEKPELLILDEPMNGLDKYGVVEIRALLKRLNEQGITIILSSHYAEDIEALCDTVCEMDNGNLQVL
ncbi:ABC-2 type transport system ATP-binding protein [Natronobacillus azotifigens]|uniref:ATP-binding cassette domain-containing protein n=1 Tax=Natronobacillus azotifigens TaxID=472978 RepID=A0A9J6RCV6_9BACI|nr:ATP-binding cassette domain-containing protein [Natronobacillus azotifigens]MCZ0703554.1 ATP-binding cassette domain-containing protein [Natronobacillus azotifigens]